MNGTSKIMFSHRDRLAVVYVRQSSLRQVVGNTESTARQYALADAARQLGWPADRIVVIDADLGISGRATAHRAGFREVSARVCLGEVGAVFALEVSRLSRSSADFQRLLELARLTGTLLVDADGVYDLADFNDRLVLGLKATMSEAELHLLAGRLQAAKTAAAARGELRLPLPIGYVYDADGATVIDPDAEVQAAVADVFAVFDQVGSAFRVVAAFTGRRFPQRVHGGARVGELVWGALTNARVLGVLTNPAYAGAYVYGRHVGRSQVRPDGTVRTTTERLGRERWPVLILDHHPGYVTWEDYLRIETRLRANRTRRGARPPREGTALCQGIINCGSCGATIGVRYLRRGDARYLCNAIDEIHRHPTPTCRHAIPAGVVDQAVADLLLSALTPAEVALTLAAADEVADRHRRTLRAAQLTVQRAAYDAARAERAFHACEPDNRLVARSLETRWEARLRALSEAEAHLDHVTGQLPALPGRAELDNLVADVHALWDAPTTSPRDRKRLLRTLICDVTVLPEPDPDVVRLGVRWHTGATDTLTCAIPPRQPAPLSTTARIIQGLTPTMPIGDIAAALNTAGHTTPHGLPFTDRAVAWTRVNHRFPPAGTPDPGEVTVAQAAARLGVQDQVVYRWIDKGRLDVRRAPNRRILIPWNQDTEATCQEIISHSPRLTHTDKATSGAAV